MNMWVIVKEVKQGDLFNVDSFIPLSRVKEGLQMLGVEYVDEFDMLNPLKCPSRTQGSIRESLKRIKFRKSTDKYVTIFKSVCFNCRSNKEDLDKKEGLRGIYCEHEYIYDMESCTEPHYYGDDKWFGNPSCGRWPYTVPFKMPIFL